jgi:hypothetical protein
MGKVVFAETRPRCDICGTTSHVLKTHQWDGAWRSYCASCMKLVRDYAEWSQGRPRHEIERLFGFLRVLQQSGVVTNIEIPAAK